MKKTKSKISLFILVFLVLWTLCSCAETDKTERPFSDYDFLSVYGNEVHNGNGEEITLKGTNAGGYLIIEQWMTAFSNSAATGYLDHKTVTEIFTQRFGKEKTLELWKYYRDNFWTEQDFKNCAYMGMNVIRLPFSYMSLDPDYNNVKAIEGQKFNFSILDNFIETAAKNGLYTILDLHGAYGSQNGQDHSGEQFGSVDEVNFFYNQEKQQKTIELWKALAERYKNNPAVAGYDLLNEPGEKCVSTTVRHWEFYDKLYKAIRDIDKKHIVIFESCWDGENLPKPADYGWNDNIMYSFHNYSGTSDYEKNLISMQNKISGVEKMNFNLPYYMGEFNCYGNEQSWQDTLQLFNEKNWSWTSWTYKLNEKPNAYNGWGIYFTKAQPVTPDVDSYDEILEKWSKLKTIDSDTYPYTFKSGKELMEVMRDACLYDGG